MATNVHMYFCCMSNWSHSAGLTVGEVNLACGFCLGGSHIIFATEGFVDEILTCARVDYPIDRNLTFAAM